MSIRPNQTTFVNKLQLEKELMLLSDSADAALENLANMQELQYQYIKAQKTYINHLERIIIGGLSGALIGMSYILIKG